MNYRSILVNLDIDRPIAPITKAALGLASRSGARLIAMCAARPPLSSLSTSGTGYAAASALHEMCKEIEARMDRLQENFKRLTDRAIESEWRQQVGDPSEALVEAARVADLVIMEPTLGASSGDSLRTADPATVVMRAGRPLLFIGNGDTKVSIEKIVIGWKDTREARRAIADALPLLSKASEVTVLSVSANPDDDLRASNADIVSWLGHHKIAAKSRIVKCDDEIIGLLQYVDTSDADLIIAGAYGHSRLREWAFGGITRFLMDETGRNRFMSS